MEDSNNKIIDLTKIKDRQELEKRYQELKKQKKLLLLADILIPCITAILSCLSFLNN